MEKFSEKGDYVVDAYRHTSLRSEARYEASGRKFLGNGYEASRVEDMRIDFDLLLKQKIKEYKPSIFLCL